MIGISEHKNNEKAVKFHAGLLSNFRNLHSKIEAAIKAKSHTQSPPQEFDEDQIGRRLGDINDLPTEIRKQLVYAQYTEFEAQVKNILDEQYNGVASLDELLVSFWREYEVKHDRVILGRKLYRLTQKQIIYSYPGKKGVYSTFNPEEIAPPLEGGQSR